MLNRSALLAGVAAVLLLAAGGTWFYQSQQVPVESDEPLPIPPIPPRIAEGVEYERCLGMLNVDPEGARALADAWVATGGGDGAEHCLALANVQLGDPGTGAEMMDTLANKSQASSTARASIYAQAGQAWLMAGDPGRAMASATLALAMAPDDVDLLVDRSIASGTLERYADVVDDLNRALELDGRRVDALVLRAAALRHMDKLDAAGADMARAETLDPDNPEMLLERGILRQRRGDRLGAREDWERAASLAPDSATADLAQQNLALLDAGPERR